MGKSDARSRTSPISLDLGCFQRDFEIVRARRAMK